MYLRLRFNRQSQVLVAERGEGGGKTLVPDNLRNGRAIEHGCKARVHDGIARAHTEGRFVPGFCSQYRMLQVLDRTLVHLQSRSQLIEAQPHECLAATEGGEGLRENRILLSLKLCQQR